jgi:nucleoside-triphosphatase THEP1
MSKLEMPADRHDVKIYFQGAMGSGKSTVAQLVTEALIAKGLRFANAGVNGYAIVDGVDLGDTIIVYDPVDTLVYKDRLRHGGKR